MGRNLVIVGATLLLFSLVSCGLGWHADMGGAGSLPGDGAMWRGVALVLLVGALLCSLSGLMGTLYAQVKRRDYEQRSGGPKGTPGARSQIK